MQLCSGAATDDHRLHSGPFVDFLDRSFLLLNLPSSWAIQKLLFCVYCCRLFCVCINVGSHSLALTQLFAALMLRLCMYQRPTSSACGLVG